MLLHVYYFEPRRRALFTEIQAIRPQRVACSVRLTGCGLRCIKDTYPHNPLACRSLPAWLSFRFGSNLYSLKFSYCCCMAGNVTNTVHASPRRSPRAQGVAAPNSRGCRWQWCDPQSQFHQRQRRLSGEFPQQVLWAVRDVCDWLKRK